MKLSIKRVRFIWAVVIPAFLSGFQMACDSSKSSLPPIIGLGAPAAVTVTYYGNGNTAGTVPEDSSKYEPGKGIITLSPKGDLYRVGYRFNGWNTSPSGTGNQYSGNEEIPAEKSLVLYAKWDEVFPKISAGENFSTLLMYDGTLYTAGINTSGRLGDRSEIARPSFVKADVTNIPEQVKMVSSGLDHSIALLKNGGLVGWGNNEYGKLGMGMDSATSNFPQALVYASSLGVPISSNIKLVCAGRYQTAVLTEEGSYWGSGSKNKGALGNGSGTTEKSLRFIMGDVVSVATGKDYVVLIKSDGSLWVAGDGSNGRLGTGKNDNELNLRVNGEAGTDNALVFAGKLDHTMLLKKNGRLLAAGYNYYGQLGIGNRTTSNVFKPVREGGSEISGVAFVSMGDRHSMILKKDGTLWATGHNENNKLGIAGANKTEAVKVMDDVAYVAAGYNHTLAVTEDGTLWAAGSNAYGQYGRPLQTTDTGVWTAIDISDL
jgi:alpha-tubulin suppressor-like RCC1 family protein